MTHLSGWDGIVDCKEKIDLVPDGTSLWECGASKDVKRKINEDFKKRNEKTSEGNKKVSTFVFVTPRVWSDEDKDEWLQKHKECGWKKIVIYTAVELEEWIEQRPAVGIWLAKKLNILPSRGFELPETYWNKWLPWRDTQLPYEIVLHGRKEISEKVVNASKNPKLLFLQALTPQEGIAFAIASLLTCEDSDKLKSRIIVATEKDAFEDLIEHYENLIIITDLTETLQYAVQQGHTIIEVTTLDNKGNSINLPKIEKEGFIKSLVALGYKEAEASKIAIDTACDINIFRRKENIETRPPQWASPKILLDLLPAFLVGKWIGTNKDDQSILESLSGITYDKYELILQTHLVEEDAPLIRIGNIWRVRSPYDAMCYAEKMLNDSLLEKYKKVCNDLIQDYDHDIVDILKNAGIQYRISQQKYSSDIKEGTLQNLCLIQLFAKDCQSRFRKRIKEIVDLLFSDWDLAKFLSNRFCITKLAEASPESFLNFIEKLPEEMLSEIFKPRESIICPNIYYLEILYAIEMLAWDKEYLNRATELLLRFSEYENKSNWTNRPSNSLYGIYRLIAPQTYVSFEDRLAVLKSKKTKYSRTIYELCKSICESLRFGELLRSHHYYRWKQLDNTLFVKSKNILSKAELDKIVELMLESCSYSTEQICDLITLSFNLGTSSYCSLIINSIEPHLEQLDEKQTVIDILKDNIRHQKIHHTLQEKDLKLYQDLFDKIKPKDLLHKHAYLFESYYVEIPTDYKKCFQDLIEARTYAIKEIVKLCGKDAIWDFINMVKYPESISESLVSLYGNDLINELCQKYKSKEIDEDFTRSYLYELCRKDVKKYQLLAKNIFESDKELKIVLFAPGYVKELAEIVENSDDSTKLSYWSSVKVGFTIFENVSEIVRELVKVNRYSDAIQVIWYNRKKISMTDLEISQVIYGYATKDIKRNMGADPYCIVELLENLDKSEDSEVINLIITIEFLLYKIIEHQYKNITKSRFIKGLTHDPNLMMKLIELVYRPDDDKGRKSKPENHTLGKIAFYILHFGCSLVPRDNDGYVDESYLPRYIEKLRSLAKEKKRINSTDRVIGFILGDIPRDDKYPPNYLCEIVDELDNDVVDRSIRIRILQSRGVTSRLCNEGGDQEREVAAQFEKYKEKVELLHRRMANIFSEIIEDYKNEAEAMDENAKIYDLEY